MTDFAFADQLLDRGGNFLDGHRWIDAMLIEQIDVICFQAPERAFHCAPDMLRTTVEARTNLALRRDVEAELGGDNHLTAHRCERFANHLLAQERGVSCGGIEKGDAPLVRGPDHPDRLLPLQRQVIHPGDLYAPKAEGRDLQRTEFS